MKDDYWKLHKVYNNPRFVTLFKFAQKFLKSTICCHDGYTFYLVESMYFVLWFETQHYKLCKNVKFTFQMILLFSFNDDLINQNSIHSKS